MYRLRALTMTADALVPSTLAFATAAVQTSSGTRTGRTGVFAMSDEDECGVVLMAPIKPNRASVPTWQLRACVALLLVASLVPGALMLAGEAILRAC